MLRPGNNVHVYLYAVPVDMRKSIDGLVCTGGAGNGLATQYGGAVCILQS